MMQTRATLHKVLEATQEKLVLHDQTDEALEMEKSPFRDRMVIRTAGKRGEFDYIATYRWEINPNGWLTVQLTDGDIMPTQSKNWCAYPEAEYFFGIERSQIQIDDPEKDVS